MVKVGDKIIPSESLIRMSEVASLDEEYKELVEAVDGATPFSDIHSDSPLRQYKQQWEQLSTFEVTPGKKLVVYNQRILVPKEMHQSIIERHHKSHLGERVLTETLQRRYLWPNLRNEVTVATRGCDHVLSSSLPKHWGRPLQWFRWRPWSPWRVSQWTPFHRSREIIWDWWIGPVVC